VSRITDYRRAMLESKAAHAGVTVAELLRQGEAQVVVNRRAWDLRSDRRSGWKAIALRAQALGNGWAVVQ
jgi:hypothetical protein